MVWVASVVLFSGSPVTKFHIVSVRGRVGLYVLSVGEDVYIEVTYSSEWIGRDDHVAGVHRHFGESGSLLRVPKQRGVLGAVFLKRQI
jgi:hypothetical protein